MEWFFLGVQVASYVVAGASLIAAATPTPKDDAIVAKVKKWVNVLALNIGGAKPG